MAGLDFVARPIRVLVTSQGGVYSAQPGAMTEGRALTVKLARITSSSESEAHVGSVQAAERGPAWLGSDQLGTRRAT